MDISEPALKISGRSVALGTRWIALALLGVLPLSASALAQGGPPLITDDPGTPGSGRWEINTAVTVEDRASGRLWGAPLIDANYGWGEHIQLKLEIPWRVGTTPSVGTVSGLGEALAGVKWRFLDQDTSGIDLGTYPQVGFQTVGSSARKGVAQDYTNVIVPLTVQKNLGFLSANIEIGWEWRSGERSHEFAGLALGKQLSERLEAIGEIHTDMPGRLSEATVFWEAGGRWTVNRHLVLLISGGSGMRGSPSDTRLRFIGYLGTQWLL